MTIETTTIDTPKATEAPAKAAEAVAVAKPVETKSEEKKADAPKAEAKPAVKTAVKAKAKTRRAPRKTKVARKAVRKAAARVTTPKKIKAVRNVTAKAAERIQTMTKKTNNAFNFGAFETLQGFAPFQNMMTEANSRGQDFAKKSQKVAEELADLAKANVEAIVEAGKIAVEGTKALGQDVIATGRDGVEQASDAIRTLAEAKSPTEYVQLQGEFARASFDRMVAETSKLTEAMVKLAGEAFQPLQNRASKNAERFNTFVA